MRILLVEDDITLADWLTKSLSAHRYVVDTVADGEQGWAYGSAFHYDLIILDVMLPKLDGLSLCQRFRAEGYQVPILLLTACSSSADKVSGLNAGADDYVIKPFDQAELMARIQALMRRGSSQRQSVLSWGRLCLDPERCEVTYGSQLLSLSAKEYGLLELFLSHEQQVFSTDAILDSLWSSEEFPAEATVRSHIRRLRQKLRSAGAPADLIKTVHGLGYYLSAPPEVDPAQTAPALAEPAACQDLPGSSTLPPEQLDQPAQGPAENRHTHLRSGLEHLALLSSALSSQRQGQLDAARQAQGQQAAHRLADSLGRLGLVAASELARSLGMCLHPNRYPDPVQWLQIDAWVSALEHELSAGAGQNRLHLPHPASRTGR
ncbi:response regulator transcription factor [Romeria aff. gracilis LEGE 07310]|uniref:Response regulator transcription factor n=1 Tax=Vasconcelosia minhoensis LEGE 07310 TaxID=915328 RepID=A0A8J7AKL4_9CYAN|nr:response regulator transcription factor [Romeria gracilis]MBE9079468.1 response regulator transcription factor [Romeria aff. gracilis LEGE 07310]